MSALSSTQHCTRDGLIIQPGIGTGLWLKSLKLPQNTLTGWKSDRRKRTSSRQPPGTRLSPRFSGALFSPKRLLGPDPRDLVDSGVPVGDPRQHKQQVAEPVQIDDQILRQTAVPQRCQRDHTTFGTATNRTGEMQLCRPRIACRQNEVLQTRATRSRARRSIDSNRSMWCSGDDPHLMFLRIRRGQARRRSKTARIGFRTIASRATPQRRRACHADRRIQFIDRSVGFDSIIVFGAPEARRTGRYCRRHRFACRFSC